MLWDNPNVRSGVEKIDAYDVGKPEDVAAAIAFLGLARGGVPPRLGLAGRRGAARLACSSRFAAQAWRLNGVPEFSKK
jgi:hypothetical protein